MNDTLARRLWPGVDPVGQQLMVGDGLTPSEKVVVGVVGDTRHHDLAQEPCRIYRPAYQAYWRFFGLIVRLATAPDSSNGRCARRRRASTGTFRSRLAVDDLADRTLAWRRSTVAHDAVCRSGIVPCVHRGLRGDGLQRGRAFAYSVCEWRSGRAPETSPKPSSGKALC